MASPLNGILAEQRAQELRREARQAGRGAVPRRDRRGAAGRLAALLSRVRAWPSGGQAQRRDAHVTAQLLVLADGRSACIRPMRCEDRAMYVDAVAGLSARSRYLRFAAPTPRISESLLNRMMDFDGDRHVAHAALTRDGSTVVGVARFIRIDADPDAAEVAIAIADRWQGGGLGAALLSTVIERAREADVRRLTATMLSENRGAAALARAVGFSATGHAGIYAEYELALGRERGGSRPDS